MPGRGRKPGQRNKHPMLPRGALMRTMYAMSIGAVLWWPYTRPARTTAATFTRYPEIMRERRYATGLWTAVGRTPGVIAMLIRIERIR